MGIIKILKNSDIGKQGETDIYPVTSTHAVYDNIGNPLSRIINDLKTSISNNGLSEIKAEAYALEASTAGVSVNVKNGNTLVFNFTLPKGKDGITPEITELENRIDNEIVHQLNYFSVLIIYGDSPNTPSGGNWDGETLTPPTGWYLTAQEVDSDTIYLSIGKCYNNGNIDWSTPTQIVGIIPTPRSAVLTYVAVVYKQLETLPSSPEGGSYDWNTGTFTSPSGWSTNPVSDNNGWFCVKAFYSDGNESPWSQVQSVAFAHKELTAALLTAIAKLITISSETLTAAINNLDWNSDNARVLINKLELSSEYASIIAGHITLSALDLNTIANNITMSANQLQIIAGNIDSSSIASLLISDDSIISTVTNAVNNKVSSIIQTPEYISQTANLIIQTGDIITTIANEVHIDTDTIIAEVKNGITLTSLKPDAGLKLGLNSLTPSIWLKADGSGYVANNNLSWDTGGELSIKGKIQSQSFTQNINIYTVSSSSQQRVSLDMNDDIAIIESDRSVIVTLPSPCPNGKILQVKLVSTTSKHYGLAFSSKIYYIDQKTMYPPALNSTTYGYVDVNTRLFSANLIYYDGDWYALDYVVAHVPL